MDKFAVDFSSLEQQASKKRAFRLSEVKDKIEKVAFDIVRFKDVNDQNIAGLWQIQSADDGDLIVAMYEEPQEKNLEVSSSWSAVLDKFGQNVSLFYKNSAVSKVALASLGIPQGEASLVCRYLPASLASNKPLAQSLLREASDNTRKQLLSIHPELAELLQDDTAGV